MGLSGKLLQIIALPGVIIIFAIVAAAAATIATIPRPGCPSKCGVVEIPFPFGIEEGCYLDKSFRLTCYDSVTLTGNLIVTNISIDTHEMNVLNLVARDCYGSRNSPSNCSKTNLYTRCGPASGPVLKKKVNPWLSVPRYTISNSKNKFTVVGCDTYAYLSGYQNKEWYNIGCSSRCPTTNNVVDGSCSGVGCCEVGFPDGLKNISVEVYSFSNHKNILDFNPCGYAFVVEKDKFNFSTNYLKNYPNKRVPLVLDWSVSNLECGMAQKKGNLACKENSECHDRQTKQAGYSCKCKQGYKGNPYLQFDRGGCHDINECEDQALNNCTEQCTNTRGSYTCACPKWYRGDGKTNGEGCSVDVALVIKVSIGIGIGLIAMLGGCSWLFLAFQQIKFIKLKEKRFLQNGGPNLEQRLREFGAKVYTFEELKVATKNYSKSMIIGQGGSSIVYKGFLSNNKTNVAIKKSKIVLERDQVGQLIKEIELLSQINHENVVKLLGCCLETEIPLQVYEFVSQDTLFNYIHRKSNACASTKRWETYLRIAAEIADALSYLHSLAIIHKDVKPSNILLDHKFTVKVSDFGISKLVPHDQKDVGNIVQGTLGYLDPEYLQTNQLTDKSDVYSFGVVLMELLTGKDVFSFDRSDDERCLSVYFLSFLKEGRVDEILDRQIVEEGNKEQIIEVVTLAEMCLRMKGDDRPSMKDLAVKLEQMNKKDRDAVGVNAQSNLYKARHVDGVTSNAYRNGGSSSTTARFDSVKDNVMAASGNG